jgi:flagellar M-ring protein FliF
MIVAMAWAERSSLNGIVELVRSLGPSRIAAMGAVAMGLVGFFAYIILRYGDVSEVPLYAGLSMSDASAIVEELQSTGTPYTLAENGTAIMVPESEVLRLRMTLAEQGLPSGGGVGYEIFDKTDALGTTSFVQNVNRLRALEGELARSIRTLRMVENARVHLVMPERQLFRRDEQKPTASIVLKTRGALDAGEIRAIQHLAASAVPGLEPGRISLVDEAGRLLAEGTGDETIGLATARVDERTSSYQRDVERRLRDIVESVVGPGRARVTVSAELDFNRVSETQDVFDPNGQVVRSTQSRDENSQTTEDGDGQVTAGNQVPNPPEQDTEAQPTIRDSNTVSEETVNYEISKTTRTSVTEVGGVKRLSVAVLVDGRYATDADGTQQYTPRPQEELDRISALVRTAMGYDQNRGDQVEIVNLQFAEGPATATEFTESGAFDLGREDLMRFAELAVMAVLTLLVLLFAVRPLVRRILEPDTTTVTVAGALSGHSANSIAAGGVATVIGPDGQAVGADGPMRQIEGPTNGRIEEARAAGAQQLDKVRRVGDLVKENPNEAALIIRNWLGEAA